MVRPKLFACTGYDFKILSTVAEKKLTTRQVETLTNNGKTLRSKGLSAKKTGKTFSAILVLQDKTTEKVDLNLTATVNSATQK